MVLLLVKLIPMSRAMELLVGGRRAGSIRVGRRVLFTTFIVLGRALWEALGLKV